MSVVSDSPPAIAQPSATVILLRQQGVSYEVLLVQRNRRLTFHGGAWVFPGGRIDAADYGPGGSDDVVAAARQAAVREANEEAGVTIPASSLGLISRWITPDFLPKRFDTWFFVAPATDQEVTVDGGEIHSHTWIAPRQALEARDRGDLELPPPTFVTLHLLADYPSSANALTALRADASVPTFRPRICRADGGACSLYEGDAGYACGEADRPGPRHRLWMLDSGWRYERSIE